MTLGVYVDVHISRCLEHELYVQKEKIYTRLGCSYDQKKCRTTIPKIHTTNILHLVPRLKTAKSSYDLKVT